MRRRGWEERKRREEWGGRGGEDGEGEEGERTRRMDVFTELLIQICAYDSALCRVACSILLCSSTSFGKGTQRESDYEKRRGEGRGVRERESYLVV